MGASGTLVTSLLTGLGLAGAAGLNAYVPLLGVAALGRMGVLTLSPPFDVLMHPVAIESWRDSHDVNSLMYAELTRMIPLHDEGPRPP